MITAAKEEMLSSFAPWCAETRISASEGESQKPHQGFAGQNPVWPQGFSIAPRARSPVGTPENNERTTVLGPAMGTSSGMWEGSVDRGILDSGVVLKWLGGEVSLV